MTYWIIFLGVDLGLLSLVYWDARLCKRDLLKLIKFEFVTAYKRLKCKNKNQLMMAFELGSSLTSTTLAIVHRADLSGFLSWSF